jgi:putative transposase
VERRWLHAARWALGGDPFSEAQFKTLKYRPAFPERFGSIQDARTHCHVFFLWYNAEHHHSGLGLLTPADVHHGLAGQRVAARATVLARAYDAHPERFPGGLPHPPTPPVDVWINRHKTRAREEAPNTSMVASPAILDRLKASRYARSTLGAAAD